MPVLIPGEFEAHPEAVADWASGYYTHGDTVDTLVRRTFDHSPSPTVRRMTEEQRIQTVYPPPASLNGSDQLLVMEGHRVGLFGKLWEAASAVSNAAKDEWKALEVRVLWCDRSIWETTHAAWCIEAQVADARAQIGRAHV